MLNVFSIKQWYTIAKLRRKPNCYIFSSKTILASCFLICAYFFTMDIILISKIKHRGPYHPFKQSTTISSILSVLTNTNRSTNAKPTDTESKSLFWTLPVKKIMMADATHFLRSPIAELVEYVLNFSEVFPFVSANSISFIHNVLSVVSIRYLAHDSLFWRQFGVCIFQFRNFLDSFDGVLYRAHAKKVDYKSNYGSFGYFVDAVSDTFGGVCLVIAMTLYFYKHPPPHIKFTKCIRLTENTEESESNDEESPRLCIKSIKGVFPFTSTSSSSSGQSKVESSYLYSQLNNMDLPEDMKSEKLGERDSQYNHKSYMQASKLVVLVSVALLGIRIAVSAIFWDRSVHNYQDILDNVPNSLVHQVIMIILQSNSELFFLNSFRMFLESPSYYH